MKLLEIRIKRGMDYRNACLNGVRSVCPGQVVHSLVAVRKTVLRAAEVCPGIEVGKTDSHLVGRVRKHIVDSMPGDAGLIDQPWVYGRGQAAHEIMVVDLGSC